MLERVGFGCVRQCPRTALSCGPRLCLWGVVSRSVLGADCLVQLQTVQPSLLKGESQGLTLLSQYNPHGIFIALENFGYLAMSLAFFLLAFSLERGGGIPRAVRILWIASASLSFAAFFLLVAHYGNNLEHRFEVAVILINWPVLVISGLLLSIRFARSGTRSVRPSS